MSNWKNFVDLRQLTSNIDKSWVDLFQSNANSFHQIEQKIKEDIRVYGNDLEIYPNMEDIFRVFQIPMNNIKVVILGMNPYHEKGQAMGLAFSVPNGVKVPPSLNNIFKEIKSEYPDYVVPNHGDLSGWIGQGIFLLNSSLTVREGNSSSHLNIGWQSFTDQVIRQINDQTRGIVFMLWGNQARNKKSIITNHLVLEATHPSPLSAYRGWFGCNHFKLANEFLVKQGKSPIIY